DSASVYVDLNFLLAEKSTIPIRKAYAYVTQATYFNYLNAGELAVENALKALEASRESPNPALEARAYYILYGVNSGWNNLKLCEKYAELSIQKSMQAKDYELLANSYSAKSIVMEFKYNEYKRAEYMDSTRYYLQQSL